MEPSAAERISPLKNINSIDQVFTKQHISQRPKSTPLWFIGNTEKILAWSQPPKTASRASVRKEGCERVRQLEEEPWRRQKLNSHLKPKKNKPPPWQKNLENPMVPLLETSGYVIMKNNCKYNTIVKSDDFFNGEPKDIRKKPNTVERNELLEQLHQQIDDLTIFLEEERFSHKQTKLRDEKILKEKLDDYCNWHNSEIREILASHEENLKKLKLEHQDELETYKDEMENRLRKSKEEYEVLQSAFRSHSNHLLEEMDTKWVKKEQELKEYYKDQQKTNFEKLRCKKIEEENQIKMAAMKAQRKEIETLKKEHRKQLQALASQYKDVTQRLETLDITEEMLSKARAELVDLKDQHGKLNKKLTSATEELTECKTKLQFFEKYFEDKVKRVDEEYRQKIHNLMLQNTELRRLFMKKCEELVNEKLTIGQRKEVIANMNTFTKLSSDH